MTDNDLARLKGCERILRHVAEDAEARHNGDAESIAFGLRIALNTLYDIFDDVFEEDRT